MGIWLVLGACITQGRGGHTILRESLGLKGEEEKQYEGRGWDSMGMSSESGWVCGRRKNGNRIDPSQPCKAAVERVIAGESESSQLQAGWDALLAPPFSLEQA